MGESIKLPSNEELRRQYFQDGGVGRGLDPEVAEDLGYKNPFEIQPSDTGTEIEDRATRVAKKIVEPMKTTPARKKATRSGLGSRQLLNADGPPPNIDDSRRTY